ncbi:MAG: hemolysin-type calcium-binding protein [Tabrizicola sp.]|nr:hemolysin-type calcium-binding protein [Tabrizicola sp.]
MAKIEGGCFIVPISQTEMDGLRGGPVGLLNVGWRWRWFGEAMRIDRPHDLLRLAATDEASLLAKRKDRRQAATQLRAMGVSPADLLESEEPAGEGFVLSDGVRSYAATLIKPGGMVEPVLMFIGTLPPQNMDLWVTETRLGEQDLAVMPHLAGLVAGSLISVADGLVQVEDLQIGDRVCTLDRGWQEVLWVGHRHVEAELLAQMPRLRPIRFIAAEDGGYPDLLVAPRQRMLVTGQATLELFSASEVLAEAGDLVSHNQAVVDHQLTDVTYVQFVLEHHSVLWANGLETESFAPSARALEGLDPVCRARLLALWPGLAEDPEGYPALARRVLSASETTILGYKHAA